MGMLKFGIFLVNLYIMLQFSVNSLIIDKTEIVLPQGRLKGERNFFEHYRKFLGIPYASVIQRFQEPGDPPSWEGTLNTKNRYIKCNQFFEPLKMAVGQEDCLVLNVFTPIYKQAELLPVMIFIHGGGFYSGSNTDLLYNPKYLIQQNVIVVTINYRLGAFGFLCLKNNGAPGNVGLKDQVAALRWVRDNIEHFGGNPQSVTIFGQGAGAAAVNYLILSQQAKGLFHRAIMESGSVLMPFVFDKYPLRSAAFIASKLGTDTIDSDELLEVFKSASANDIVEATHQDGTNAALAPYIFRPCIESSESDGNAMIMSEPVDMLHSMKIDYDIEIIIGFNNKEGIKYAARYDDEGFKELNVNFDKLITDEIYISQESDKVAFVNNIKEIYFKNSSIDKNSLDNLIDYLSDVLVIYPSIATTAILLNNPNVSVYNYYFKYDSFRNLHKLVSGLPTTPGANNGDELFYLFDPVVYQPLSSTVSDLMMMKRMIKMWTKFAINSMYKVHERAGCLMVYGHRPWTPATLYLNPTPSATQVQWNKSSKDQTVFLEINQHFKMTTIPNKGRMNFWSEAYKKFHK